MKVEKLEGAKGYKVFSDLAKEIYIGNTYYRGTEASIEKLLLLGPTSFHSHATVKFFVIRDGNDLVARFALIHDRKLPDYVQISFFEALPGLTGILDMIKTEGRSHFPGVPKILAGLNGHLNYGAGFLMDNFDKVPVFGLPYTHAYYPKYFESLKAHPMVTFRFALQEYVLWLKAANLSQIKEGITTRIMNKKKIKEEFKIYTNINNLAFKDHPFWADRTIEEDLELFYPFRFLLNNENLIFAEYNGKPVGFFLWYPDFNQLVKGSRDLNLVDWLRYRTGAHIDTFRFAEIGILPEYRKGFVSQALFMRSVPFFKEIGLKYCEAGFIFEANKASMALLNKYMIRFFGHESKPYRRYALFEGDL